ncbi:WD40 repeat domain-containing protein, partial [Dactylosporangium salmoneum]|uniref:WD40 repeat domain-containing protein n=1 Tax=Dactylosporangium salmoneum TaxID=53361 RepID=UPI003CD07D09
VTATVAVRAAGDAADRARAEAQRRAGAQIAAEAATPGLPADTALLLHAAAYLTAPGQQADALWQKAATYPGLRRVLRMPATGTVDGVAFSPDGRWLAAATSQTTDGHRGGVAILWPASGDGIGVPVPATPTAATSIAFSPDGQLLAVGGATGTVTLLPVPADGAWPAAAEAAVTLPAPVKGQEVERISFAPDGTLIAAGYTDGQTRLWDRRTARITATFEGRRGAFDPGGQAIASLDAANRVVVRRTGTLDVAATTAPIPGAADLAYR